MLLTCTQSNFIVVQLCQYWYKGLWLAVQIVYLVLTNNSALFKCFVAMLLHNLFVKSDPGHHRFFTLIIFFHQSINAQRFFYKMLRCLWSLVSISHFNACLLLSYVRLHLKEKTKSFPGQMGPGAKIIWKISSWVILPLWNVVLT